MNFDLFIPCITKTIYSDLFFIAHVDILSFWHSYIISHWMHATFLGETYWKHGAGEQEEWYVDTKPLWHCGWLLLLWFKSFAEMELMGVETGTDPVCDTWNTWMTNGPINFYPNFWSNTKEGWGQSTWCGEG